MEEENFLLEEFDEIQQREFEVQRKIASKYLWNFSKFKSIVSKFIKRNNNEEQWIFDFKCYCSCLSESHYEHPLKWAEEFYQEDFDSVKYKEFLNRLAETIKSFKS